MARRSESELASQLRLSVMRLTRRLRAEQVDTTHTLTQRAALATIERHGPMSPGELAAHERVQPPSMTRVVAKLGDEGLLERHPHPTDGRQQLLSITAAGRELLELDRQSRQAWLSRRLSELDDAEREILEQAVAVFDRLSEA